MIQGFGNVGSWAARIVAELGCQRRRGLRRRTAPSTPRTGSTPRRCAEHVARAASCREFDAAPSAITHEELLALECEVFIPAALGGMIHADNADRSTARLVLEGANAPTTPTADEILADKGVHVVPDVLANAGGVVVSYFEWVQNLQHFRWSEREVNDKLGTIMRRAYREVARARAAEDDVPLRVAAYELGIERVVEAARTRGYICGREPAGRRRVWYAGTRRPHAGRWKAPPRQSGCARASVRPAWCRRPGVSRRAPVRSRPEVARAADLLRHEGRVAHPSLQQIGRCSSKVDRPSARIAAPPPTRTRVALPEATRAGSGRPISTPCSISQRPRPVRGAHVGHSGPAAEPVAGSSPSPPCA